MPDILPNKKEPVTNNSQTVENENLWTTAMYAGGVITIFPISNIVIPLLIWLLKKEQSNTIKKHGINVLNFQITISLAFFLTFVIGASTFFLFITIPLAALFAYVIIITNILLSTIGAIKAYKGNYYELPFKYDFLKKFNLCA